MTNERKRMGRPTKAPTPGARSSLGLKVTAAVKDRLDSAARESGRTQSQEAEVRLERSFEREALLTEVLDLAYGRPLAGILMLVGLAMDRAGTSDLRVKEIEGGGDDLWGHSLRARSRDWSADPHAFDQAIHAAHSVLQRLRAPDAPDSTDATIHTAKQLEMLLADIDNPGWSRFPGDPVCEIKPMLGPIADRLGATGEGDDNAR